MRLLLVMILFSQINNIIYCQVLLQERRTDWALAGLKSGKPNFTYTKLITAFGGKGDSIIINDDALQAAINALPNTGGNIFFPPGIYLFHQPINLPENVVLKGAGSESTKLVFDLGGQAINLIDIAGNVTSTTALLSQDAFKDEKTIKVQGSSNFSAGDDVLLNQGDAGLIYSGWATGSVGQVLKIKQRQGNTITFESPLRHNFLVSDTAKITKLNLKKHVGIECLKIERADFTTAQTTNINYYCAAECWIEGVESNLCNFAHVSISLSSNILIRGNYLHHAFAYGIGGQGYGISLQASSGECLIENNQFNNLRHSMLLQGGANGNVLGYNYSVNPYWTDIPIFTNTAGDVVMHGNYPFLNLIEGNIVQNIVIDDSHGINGNYNTFFRNRAELYGIVLNNSIVTNNQNFIGNEIIGTSFPLGNYFLTGTGHFEYANNKSDTIIPLGTDSLLDVSYYRHTPPLFWNQSQPYPNIGSPYYNTGTIPAKENFLNHIYAQCSSVTVATSEPTTYKTLEVFPVPSNGEELSIKADFLINIVNISDVSGNNFNQAIINNKINIGHLPNGIYYITCRDSLHKDIYRTKFVILK